MPTVPPYVCGACGAAFERFEDFQAHRTRVHGALSYDARPTLEQRIAALEQRIEVLSEVIKRMQESDQP